MALRRYARKARPMIARAVVEKQRLEDCAEYRRGRSIEALLRRARPLPLRVPLHELHFIPIGIGRSES